MTETPFSKAMMKIAEEVYPGCIKIVGTEEYAYLDIRWDDIVIRNRNNASHRIQGMHVSLPFITDRKQFRGRIHGWRDTLSYAEQRSGYAHSHLPGTSFNSFCTGMDGINNVWGMVQTDSINYRSVEYKDTFRGFLYLLDAFIKYESLEGVPHRRISRIGLGSRSGLQGTIPRREARRIMSNIDKKLLMLSVDFNSGTADLVETDKLHSEMAKHTSKLAHRLPNGTYMSLERLSEAEAQLIEDSNMSPIDPETGRTFNVVILANKSKVEITDVRKFIHPDILDYIKTKVKGYAEQQITERTVREFEQEGFQHKAIDQDKREREISTDRKFSSSAFAVSYAKTKSGVVWEPPLDIPEEDGPYETIDSNTDSHVYETAESR